MDLFNEIMMVSGMIFWSLMAIHFTKVIIFRASKRSSNVIENEESKERCDVNAVDTKKLRKEFKRDYKFDT